MQHPQANINPNISTISSTLAISATDSNANNTSITTNVDTGIRKLDTPQNIIQSQKLSPLSAATGSISHTMLQNQNMYQEKDKNMNSDNNTNNITNKSNLNENDNAKKDLDHIVPNAKTTTTTQSNGSTTTKQNMTTPTCKNCKTQTTPLWRRDETGQVLCNACGLFLKLHGRPRPISLKSDVIKSRNRVKHNNKSSPNTPELKAKDSANTTNNNSNSHSNQLSNQSTVNNNSSNINQNNLNNGHSIANSNNLKIPTKFLPKQYRPNSKAKSKKQQQQSNNKSDNALLKDQNNLLKLPPSSAASVSKPKLENPIPFVSNQPLNSITSPSLLPLLPRGQLSQNLPPGTPYTYASTTAWLNKNQGANIQSLNYPSSTPTQFVSGLNRITSPLLLSTTAAPPKLNPTPLQSQSSERSSSVNGINNSNNNLNLNRDAVLNAAGALEILSQQASSSSSNNSPQTDFIPGMRLNSPHLSKVNSQIGDKLPPISLVTSNEKEPNSNNNITKNTEPTHLHNILSPQYHNEPKSKSKSNNIIAPSPMVPQNKLEQTSLPPIASLTNGSSQNDNHSQHLKQQQQQQLQQQQQHISQATLQQQGQPLQHTIASPSFAPHTQLPSLKYVPGISNVMYSNGNSHEELRSQSMNTNNDVSLLSINNNNSSALHEENEKLRTRISELELVNDLYKTRINDLELNDKKNLNKIQDLEEALNMYRQSQTKVKIEDSSQILNNYSIGEKRQSSTNDDDLIEKRIKVEN